MSRVTTRERTTKIVEGVTFTSSQSPGASASAIVSRGPISGQPTVGIEVRSPYHKTLHVNGRIRGGLMQHMTPADAKRFGQGIIAVAEGMGA